MAIIKKELTATYGEKEIKLFIFGMMNFELNEFILKFVSWTLT